jgi:hypothetical protein
MANLVFLSQVSPEGWLHWARKGNASCLRDFRFSPLKKIRNYATTEIQALLQQPGNVVAAAPARAVTDTRFWSTLVSRLNKDIGAEQIRSLLAEGGCERVVVRVSSIATQVCREIDANHPQRSVTAAKDDGGNLVDRFKSEVHPLILHTRTKELETLLTSWTQRLACVKRKDCFNHWDDDDASDLFSLDTGIGWTSIMLERCRAGGKLHHIGVGDGLDFALLSMELNLGISSKRNFFRMAHRDYVKPDGLGIRSEDGSYCVVEVKGPQDEGDLCEATLQALCGALAVVAKREMIVEITGTSGKRRPAIRAPLLPADRATLGLYVIMSEFDTTGATKVNDDPKLGTKMEMLLQSCPVVREIAHFVIDPGEESFFDRLTPREVFRKP